MLSRTEWSGRRRSIRVAAPGKVMGTDNLRVGGFPLPKRVLETCLLPGSRMLDTVRHDIIELTFMTWASAAPWDGPALGLCLSRRAGLRSPRNTMAS